MRVPDVVKNGVFYLGGRTRSHDPKSEDWIGTGFMVAFDQGGVFFRYLVTAHHVLTALKNLSHPVIRFNDAGGAAHTEPAAIKLHLIDHKKHYKKDDRVPVINHWDHWVRHPTDLAADVAICEYRPRPNGVNMTTYSPREMLLQPAEFSKYGIGIGDETFIVGLFHDSFGDQQHNAPIIRMGNIAMLPKHRIEGGYGMAEVYLIEARSIASISGSPVYVRETVILPDKVSNANDEWIQVQAFGDFRLLGIAIGHWDVDSRALNSANATHRATIDGGVNVGIAVVTPAQKILETLNHPKLVAERDECVSEFNKPR